MPTRADAPAPKPIGPQRTGPQRTAAAAAGHEQESQLKRIIDRVDVLLDRLDAQEAALAAEIKRLEARKDHIGRRRDRIEARVLKAMSAHRMGRALGNIADWTAKPNAESLMVDDERAIPSEWMRQPKPGKAQPDKVAIKVALAADPDLVIAGCHLEQSVSLQRKK
jgi:hypothetical protein